MGRPAKYRKPLMRTYRVSQAHVDRVEDLRAALKVASNSDVIEEATMKLHKRLGLPPRGAEDDPTGRKRNGKAAR